MDPLGHRAVCRERSAVGGGEVKGLPERPGLDASPVQVTQEGGNRMFVFRPGVSLDALVRAVNQVGAAPGDVVAILDALKRAGALKAELVVI